MPLVSAQELHYFQTDGRYDYRTELLQLALSYSESEGADSITLVPRADIPVARGIKLVQQEELVGVLSLAASPEREKQLLSVKIPIMAGILGMRVFLIHKDSIQDFKRITSLAQLQQKSLGFGEHWADLSILEDNGFSVQKVTHYQSLFNMLNAKRFEFFPRGINEIFGEYQIQVAKLKNLAIEETLAIYYPYPIYFYLAKKDVELANRIRFGLQQSLADGRFKQLLLDYHKGLLEQLNFNNRRLFYLSNREIAVDAIENIEWWLPTSQAD